MVSLHVKSERGISMNGGGSSRMWVAGREGISIGGCKMGIVRVFTETARVAAPGLSYIVCVVCRDAGHGSGLGEV